MFVHTTNTGGGIKIENCKDRIYFDTEFPSSIEMLRSLPKDNFIMYSLIHSFSDGVYVIPIYDYSGYITLSNEISSTYDTTHSIHDIANYLLEWNIDINDLIKIPTYDGRLIDNSIQFASYVDSVSRFIYYAIQGYSKRNITHFFKKIVNTECFTKIPSIYKIPFNLCSSYSPIPNIDGSKLDEGYIDLMKADIKKKMIELGVIHNPNYLARLKYEWGIIRAMGFLEYFYIVYDYIKYAKSIGMFVGVGRGSACGSLVCYLLSITEIDPIKHTLYFERFLNADRISMPDIDSDFEERDTVKEYLIKKYGRECTMDISVEKTLKSISAINHAYAALASNPPRHITSHIISDAGVLPTLDEVIADSNIQKIASEIDMRLLTLAKSLEGAKIGVGVHASGFIVATDNIRKYVPVACIKVGASKKSEVVTNIDPSMLEDFNLIKFDILGISKLKFIRTVLELAGVSYSELFNTYAGDWQIPSLYNDGYSLGTFQLTKSYSVEYARKLKICKLEDIAFLLSVIRPATLPLIKQVVKYLETGEPQEYHLEETKDICADTHGLLIYQEQVMRLAVEYAGYTLNQADELRSVMGKKKLDKIDEQRSRFVSGAVIKGHLESRALEVFTYIERFAKYGFNKSHALAYAVLNLQMGILKYIYPKEFYAASLLHETHDSELLRDLLDEAIDRGVKFEYPCVVYGGVKPLIHGEAIYFGLINIKRLRADQADKICRLIKDFGITTLEELFYKLPSSLCTKTLHEALFTAGAYRNLKGCSVHFMQAIMYRISKQKNKSYIVDYSLVDSEYSYHKNITSYMDNLPNIKYIQGILNTCDEVVSGYIKVFVKRIFTNKKSGKLSILANDGNSNFFATILCLLRHNVVNLTEQIIHVKIEVTNGYNGNAQKSITDYIHNA
jgi:DNA-directed DNA polymerase III PolC